MQLKVRTTTNMPAFNMSVQPTDSILAVTKAAAKKANVKKPFIRLSRGRSWLNPKDSVEALGMKDGTVVMLHVRNQPLIKNINCPPALPVFSFASGGYGFFISVVTFVTRKEIWRPKVFPTEDLGKLVLATARKAKCKECTIKFKRPSGETVKIEKGKNVMDYDIRANDELVVHGLPEEQDQTAPRTHMRFSSGSLNARSRSSRKVVPFDGGVQQVEDWLPVGPI